MHADGGAPGLYLAVGPNSRSWIFRYQLGERRREMGLGSIRLYDLQRARDTAIDFGRGLREGIDPFEHRRQWKAAQKPTLRVTFGDVALAYIDAHKAEWATRNVKSNGNMSLRLHVLTEVGKLSIAESIRTLSLPRAQTALGKERQHGQPLSVHVSN